MRFRLALTFVAVALCAAAARAQEPQPPDQQIFDDFVTTRGVVFEEPGAKKPGPKPAPKPKPKGSVAQRKPRRQPAKGGAAPQGAGSEAASKQPAPAAQGAGVAAGGASPTPAADATFQKAGARPLALGYTLFRREAGRLVVTDTSREFRERDRMLISLETNADAYVYVFNTTNGAEPVMLFPYAGVAGGTNRVAAHQRDLVPPASEYEFDERPGTERIYVVVSRRPLAGIPVGEELISRCGGAVKDCYWQPTADEWSRIKAQLVEDGGAREGRLTQLARLQPAEPETLTRGIRVRPEEPPPAVVRVSDSPAANLLVTTIELIHK
jgi:hypothetical protein